MFRNAVFTFLAVAALAACALPGPLSSPTASVPPPAELANRTELDERAALGVELAYSAFVTAAELAVDAGVLRGENATRVAALDARAYQALAVARAAYDTGNAETYSSALLNARTAIAEAVALIKGPRS